MNCIKYFNLRFALFTFSVLLQQVFIIGNSKVRQVLDIMQHRIDLLLHIFDMLISFKTVKFGDTFDLDLRQSDNVFLDNLSSEHRFVGSQTFVNSLQYSFPGRFFLDVAIDTFFDKYFFQRRVVPVIFQLAEFNLQFLFQQLFRQFYRTS
ncbi:hypothetical protein D3C86_1144920 [compost metagenome]